MSNAARTADLTLADYYHPLRRAAATVAAQHSPAPGEVPFALPELDQRMADFLSVTSLRFADLAPYRGTALTLLDLTGNPGTRTTKTFASHIIVARAVAHIRDTGEPVTIVTPSSGNKATALRDAVYRAVLTGLAGMDELNIVSVVPHESAVKLWASPLSENPGLWARNPLVLHAGPDRGAVKPLVNSCLTGPGCLDGAGRRVWATLDLDNYRVADAVRAFAEHEVIPQQPGRTRLHAHAVSSAFGLLGHHLGQQLIADPGWQSARYFLVQHLDTPDMVLNLHFGSPSRAGLPVYTYRADTGLFHQDSDPRYPMKTTDTSEIIDLTFYTRSPATSALIDPLIRKAGGGGHVVSLVECLERYAEIRAMLGPVGLRLPADPRQVREWSLIMVLTGVLTAIDRGLLAEDEIVIHGSGHYTTSDYEPVPPGQLLRVDDPAQLAAVIRGAIAACG